MSNYIGVRNYEQMIFALTSFMVAIKQANQDMEVASNICKINMPGDPNVAKADARLRSAIGRIAEQMDAVEGIISKMEDELEAARQAGKALE